MYIKRIIIRGFKTYKNETVIEDFSPHHNVVVGRNGSGKSNFFAAIRFVLSDAYNNLSREERQSLIHESSVSVMSAFVEIIFDNTDRRLPIAKDEISIRRTIGLKKDDYSLDYKSATKSDVMSLLEAAGFSKSNPYYIVPQGRVTSLTNAKDSERLELMKDVAGARVFESKLKESLKEMNVTGQKQDQIKLMLEDIENRLEELNMEKEDLKSFEKLNNSKKMLEYNIYDKELKSLSEQMEEIDADYSKDADNSYDLGTQLEQREKKIQQLLNTVSNQNSEKRLLEIDLNENHKEIQDILSKIGTLSVQLQESKILLEANSEDSTEKLNEVREKIDETKAKLENLKPQHKNLKNKEQEIKLKINELQLKQTSLISQKNNGSRFKNKKERDLWLKHQIVELERSNEFKHDLNNETLKEIDEVNKRIKNLNERKDSIKSKLNMDSEISRLDLHHNNLKLQSRNLIDERSILWREESKLNSIITNQEENKSTIEQELSGTIDRSSAKGIDIVKKIAQKLGPNVESGVYGYLGELIEVSEKYKTAVDVVGGNSLFHVVVNTDQTASLIIDELRREKAGRVTFIPLNRLADQQINYPTGNDSVPLIKKIAYEEYLTPAVKQIFGKTVVCVSLSIGAQISQTHKLNAITLDGDRCDRKGVLSGGFRDHKFSRVDLLKKLKNCKSEIFKTSEKIEKLKSDICLKDTEINKIHELIAVTRKDLDSKLSERSSLISKLSKLENEYLSYQQELESKNSKSDDLKSSIKLIDNKILQFSEELKSEFSHNSLSAQKENTLQEIFNKLPKLEQNHNSLLQKLEELELEKSMLSSSLSENLVPLYNQLNAKIYSGNNNQKKIVFQYEDLNRQHSNLLVKKNALENSNTLLNEQIKLLHEKITSNNEEIEKLNELQRAVLKQIDECGKSADNSLVKRSRLRNRRQQISKILGELGILPEETFTSFKNESSNGLSKRLSEVNEQLKSFNHVNKKALEQFVSFTKQRDSLVERMGELEKAKASIEHLIYILQKRKNDAIIRAFKNVSKGFSDVFEKLVPNGKGKLIIQKKSDVNKNDSISLSQVQPKYDDDSDESEDSDNESETHDSQSQENMDSYVGISISVSFNSKKNEQQRIEQLSGGQKSLCALGLILAIQSCDPAPFYLFDEIDANLDAQYRTSVANLVHQLSQNAQFICTTFRPEMLKISDKFYGVMFNNKVSTISDIDRERALEFVEGQNTN